VVRRLRALASRGVPISVRYLLPAHADLVGQALAIFGSFDRARAIAGLPAPPLEHDVDVIIGALRSLARSGVRLDVATLTTMGESGLVAACVETCGSVAAAAARAGLGASSPPAETSRSRGAPTGFAQPPISADGQVSTSLALETLQKTALQLGRVPAARDLPPDVARRLTTDYGSVRFAYLALRIHAEGQAGQRTAEGAAQAAAEPVAVVSQEALDATARMPDQVGVHRRNVEAREASSAARPAAGDDGDDDDEPPGVDVDEIVADAVDADTRWSEIEARIDEAAEAAAASLRAAIGAALEGFVAEVTELARHATLSALVPDRQEEE
jgi:hypothetical protein